MADSLAGVVLAAGAGTRLRPLTLERPKVLFPVGGVALVDLAIDRLGEITDDVAVNLHHGRRELEAHLAGRVHESVEEHEALGTAGALAVLREWIDGRPVVAVNGDTWCPGGLPALLDGWDGERIRVLVAGDDGFAPGVVVAGAVMPNSEIARFEPRPSGLVESSWGRAHAEGRLETVPHHGPCIDCGTPADYLAANRAALGLAGLDSRLGAGADVSGSVSGSDVGAGSVVRGDVSDSVLWPGVVVGPYERLHRAVRTLHRTVLVRG